MIKESWFLQTLTMKHTYIVWMLLYQAVEQISVARELANNMKDDLDLHIFKHDMYGKGFIKTCKMSPDAYIQLALQLAHYKVGRYMFTVILLRIYPGIKCSSLAYRVMYDKIDNSFLLFMQIVYGCDELLYIIMIVSYLKQHK